MPEDYLNFEEEGEEYGAGPGIYTVSQITARIKDCLEITFDTVWVEGEISNARISSSGHLYFSLKDEGAQIRAVVFRGVLLRLNFTPEDGMRVICRARLSVYEPKGEYQLIVSSMERKGVGELYAEFERLKRRLMEEGLFDEERKKRVPFLPVRVGIVTSPTGAAIRDILKVMERRFPDMEIYIVPVKVQGDGAALEIAEGIRTLSDSGKVEVMIVGRGGGSLEDLWAFNEEVVARAIADSKVPVVSAVGHEIDFTISDFVADLRAPTPSAAAEMITRDKMELLERVDGVRSRLKVSFLTRIGGLKSEMASFERRMLLREPGRRVEDGRIRVDDLDRRCISHIRRRLKEGRKEADILKTALLRVSPLTRAGEWREALSGLHADLGASMMTGLKERRTGVESFSGLLASLSPLRVLARGYSITFAPEGKILRDFTGVKEGEEIRTILHRGSLTSTVKEGRGDGPGIPVKGKNG